MAFFIFTLILMFSLAGILYLSVRVLPRLDETARSNAFDGNDIGGGGANKKSATGVGSASGASAIHSNGILDRWSRSEWPEKIDAWFNNFLLKFLRKFKVFVLKLDNATTSRLHKVRRNTAEGKKTIDFKDMTEEKE